LARLIASSCQGLSGFCIRRGDRASLAQKPFIVPIPGTRNIDHLNENLGAIDIQLTPGDLREIDTAVSKIKVHGGRMNEQQMKVVDQTA